MTTKNTYLKSLFSLSLLTLALLAASGSNVAQAQVASTTQATTSAVTPFDPLNPADIEAKVRSYFADFPTMAAIAQCESGFRQFDSDGTVLFDPSYSMIGIFQESSAHLAEALDLGMNILTVDGNLAYARHLYQTNGIDPWMDSYKCWGSIVKSQGSVLGTSTSAVGASSSVTASATAPTTVVSQTAPATSYSVGLALGMSGESVMALQQSLNKAGFVVAASGAGSPGQETMRFGMLTRDAVRRFQCAKGIVCSGDESTTGYGEADDRTQAALAAALSALVATAATPTAATSTQPATTPGQSSDKAAQIAQVESQITALTNQLDTLNRRLTDLTR